MDKSLSLLFYSRDRKRERKERKKTRKNTEGRTERSALNNKEHLEIDDLPKESRELKDEKKETREKKDNENKSTIPGIVMFRRLAFPAFEVRGAPAETGPGRRRTPR